MGQFRLSVWVFRHSSKVSKLSIRIPRPFGCLGGSSRSIEHLFLSSRLFRCFNNLLICSDCLANSRECMFRAVGGLSGYLECLFKVLNIHSSCLGSLSVV